MITEEYCENNFINEVHITCCMERKPVGKDGKKTRKTAHKDIHETKHGSKADHKPKVHIRAHAHKDTHGTSHAHTMDKKTEKHSMKRSIHKTHRPYSKKFCPKCGNPIVGESTFCKDCRTIDFDFKDIKILLCNNCGSYNHKNKWQRFHKIDDVVRIAVSEGVKHDIKYHGLDDDTEEELLSYKAGVHKNFNVKVSLGKENYDLPAVVDVTLCPKCSKQGTKYFEGVLQVRNTTDEINGFIRNDLAKQRSKGIHINKIVEIGSTGTDIDYYYTDKGYLKVIAEKLRKNFGAVIKHNAQLFSVSWETSKNIYRLNVLVEFPHYHKNDVLKIGKQLFKVMSMDEKIHVTNIETGAKTLLPHKESYDILKPVEVMLIKKYPEYEVLDPNTYYQARLMNPQDNLQINQKIHVVVDGGEAWMI